MSTALYICIDCELANANAQPTLLNEHQLCPRCGSSSVVPVDTLLELDRKRKAKSEAPLSTTDNTKKQWQAIRDHRMENSKPLRSWLTATARNSLANEQWHVEDILKKWDGWAWHVHYPWESDYELLNSEHPAPGHFVVELVQGVKNGPRWVIVLDSEVSEVRSFQDGANQP